MRYSIQPRYRIFVKGYGFVSFAKSIGKSVRKNINKNVSGKCSPGMLVLRQKLLDHAKQARTDVLKTTSKTVIHQTVKATRDLMGNKITSKIIKVPQNSQKIITDSFK